MSAALNSVKTFRVRIGTFGDKNLLKRRPRMSASSEALKI
jgi:hypothetical protein